MKGIRSKQRQLVEILTSKAYAGGTLRPSTKALLQELIEQCAKYERSKGPFNHDATGSPCADLRGSNIRGANLLRDEI